MIDPCKDFEAFLREQNEPKIPTVFIEPETAGELLRVIDDHMDQWVAFTADKVTNEIIFAWMTHFAGKGREFVVDTRLDYFLARRTSVELVKT